MTRCSIRNATRLLAGLGLSSAHCQHVDIYSVTRAPASSEAVDTEPAPASTSSETGDGHVSSSPLAGQSSNLVDSGSFPGETSSETTAPSACPGPVPVAGNTDVMVAVGSLSRRYVLHVPLDYDPGRPLPLIIDFHGAGGSAAEQLATSPYPPVTDPEGVVMVFPEGVSGPIGAAWNVGPCCVPGVDDLAFVDAIIADVKQRICVDAARIYAVGVLTGGGMAHYLACERSEVFAAVSPAAFDLLEETVDDCKPSAATTVVAFRATADARVPYAGGSSNLVPSMPVTFLGAQASFERWAALDGCVGEPTEPDADGCSSYSNCTGDAEVVLCTKDGGMSEPGDAAIAWPILRSKSRR